MNSLLTMLENSASTEAGKVISSPVVSAVTSAAASATKNKSLPLAQLLALAVLVANVILQPTNQKTP